MSGLQAFERSGLDAPTATAALHDDLEHHKQLAAAREANRGVMVELNRL